MATTKLAPSSNVFGRIQELTVDDGEDWASAYPPIPHYHASTSALRDDLETETSKAQDDVTNDCLPFLTENPFQQPFNSKGIPKLQRQNHIDFLRDALEDYPAPYTAYDASRPWIYYWSLNGLSMLGDDAEVYRERLAQTLSVAQSPTGGFGGGFGQYAHVAGSYAAVLSLAIVGGTEAYDVVDRKAMWYFLGNMKQPDGGFTVAPGAEEDIRGAYCAMTIITLLNLPLELPPTSPARVNGDETFLTNLPEWIARCQSFEGGIGASPGNEAHGAYAFCALACLSLIGEPHETISGRLDVPKFIKWLSSQQRAPEGGFAGRTNKLVDGCYSHWVGGCWSLIQAALDSPSGAPVKHIKSGQGLWSRNGLARWILCCCQAKDGGLRDKPRKYPDAYHTCYNLAGLCAAQYSYRLANAVNKFAGSQLSAAFNWVVNDQDSLGVLNVSELKEDVDWCWDEKDLLNPVHPVFVIPIGQAEKMRAHYEAKEGF